MQCLECVCLLRCVFLIFSVRWYHDDFVEFAWHTFIRAQRNSIYLGLFHNSQLYTWHRHSARTYPVPSVARYNAFPTHLLRHAACLCRKRKKNQVIVCDSMHKNALDGTHGSLFLRSIHIASIHSIIIIVIRLWWMFAPVANLFHVTKKIISCAIDLIKKKKKIEKEKENTIRAFKIIRIFHILWGEQVVRWTTQRPQTDTKTKAGTNKGMKCTLHVIFMNLFHCTWNKIQME